MLAFGTFCEWVVLQALNANTEAKIIPKKAAS
jgi:hypothetical protein